MEYPAYMANSHRETVRKKRKAKKFLKRIILLSFLLLCVTISALALRFVLERTDIIPRLLGPFTSAQQEETYIPPTPNAPGGTQQNTPWNLQLINAQHPLVTPQTPPLTTLSNGLQVDSRIYPALQAMFDAARAQGYYPVVASGYRTKEQQQALFAIEVEKYRAQGYSQPESEQMALALVARPGTSEHEAGLAVDINGDKVNSTNEDVYRWMEQNSYKFGFILRYRADQIAITGVGYEPWHFRYVGEQAATEIFQQGISLEQYSQQ